MVVRRTFERSRAGVVAMLCLMSVSCTVVPLEADRAAKALQNGAFDAKDYVDANWSSRAVPGWNSAKQPLDQLVVAADADVDAAGKAHGRQAGEGSAWTFVVTAEGRVTAVDRQRRAGVATLDVAGVARPVQVQIGPVVGGFALRDSLAFIDFDDFPNQIAYADAGRALTDKAFATIKGPAQGLKVGDTVVVTGVLPYGGKSAPLLITPISIASASPR